MRTMKHWLTSLALLGASVGVSGCAAMFTDIRAIGDGTYTVTYTKQGVFRVYGEVLHCVPAETGDLICESVDRL